MNTKFLLPFAAVSALALAACGGDTPPPAQPDPDAGTEVTTEDTSETVTPEPVEEPSPSIEEIEQEAAETFEQIMEETQQTGNDLIQSGSNAMQSMTEQLEGVGQSLEEQVDNLVVGLEDLRDDNLTDEQKLQAVASARTAAENAARLAGRDDAEIRSIGDSTEERARTALGL